MLSAAQSPLKLMRQSYTVSPWRPRHHRILTSVAAIGTDIGQTAMAKQISDNKIEHAKSNVNGIKSWLTIEYTPRKRAAGASKTELYRMLEPRVSDIRITALAILMHQANAKAALGVFVLGANLHLKLLQELTLVDPNTDDPMTSS